MFSKQPELVKAIPSLLASRDKVLDILTIDEQDNMSFEQLNFSKIDTSIIKDYVDFMDKSGLLNFLQYQANRSLVDYVYGIEAGLDSNARKNRSGTTMEGILERHVAKIADDLDLKWKAQATAPFIKLNWNIDVPVDKSERRFDVAIYSKKLHKVWLIETNYYGGGGSKLKAVASEFTELSHFVTASKDKVEFVWVTDGQGWKTAHLPLSEAFGHITNVFNLNMLKEGFLLDLLRK
ncbi:Type-2 restriction enzyme MboI [Chlamydia trachomatis]|nr:Type-2 restriction enzyme MboI [Chlamydia trachomatis]